MDRPTIPAPFRIIVDTREQLPWRFEGMTAGAVEAHAVYRVETIVRGLDSGDYTIEGRESEIRIERKSAADLMQTLAAGRKRFEAELDRLASFPFSCVLVEDDLSSIIRNPPTKMSTRSFVGSVVALSQRHPSRWYFAGSRQFAEALAFRIFERWHRDRERETKPPRRRKPQLATSA